MVDSSTYTYIYIYTYLVGGIPTPQHMTSSVGTMKFMQFLMESHG